MKCVALIALLALTACNAGPSPEGQVMKNDQHLPPAPIVRPRALSPRWREVAHHGQRQIVDLAFEDTSRGWAVYDWGAVLETSDGGSVWKSIPGMERQKRLRSVSIRTSNEAYVVGGDFNSDEEGPPELIKYTGSEGWLRVDPRIHAEKHLRFDRIRWINQHRGYIRGRELIVTNDSGITWNVASLDHYPVTDVALQGEHEGWYVSRSRMFYSRDGCKTWKLRAELDSLLQWQDKESLVRILAANSVDLWVVGSRGTLLKSTDGGDTWSLVTRFPSEFKVKDITFVSKLKGWAIVIEPGRIQNYLILHTGDGGVHWTREWEGDLGLNCLYFHNERNGWAAGEVVLRYER